MIKMNSLMENVIKDGKDTKVFKAKRQLKIKKVCDDIVNKTKLIKDCVFYDEANQLSDDMEFNFKDDNGNIITDYTEYEYEYNDTGVNLNLIYNNEILYFMDMLSSELCNKYPNRRFCIIFSLSEDFLHIRFYTYRNEEGFWEGLYNGDLDSFAQPVMYKLTDCDNLYK